MVYKPVLNCFKFLSMKLYLFLFWEVKIASFSLHNFGILFGMFYTKMFLSEKQGRFTCVRF